MKETPRDDAFDFAREFPRAWAALRSGWEQGLHLGGQIYVSREGRPLANLGFGWARPGLEMRRDHIVIWLSAGKPLTAVATLQQVERGGVGLDTRVCDLIPEFGSHGKEGITVRHLLTPHRRHSRG